MSGAQDAAFQALVRQGNQARFAGEAATAETAYRAALKMRPDNAPVMANLGLLLLSVGRYAEGWPLYEARKLIHQPDIPPPPLPEWRGEPLAGKSLLVWAEQGLGDEIQMARFIAPLKAMGARVTLACSPPLVRLFKSLKVPVLAITPQLKLPRADFQVLMMSLPARLALTLETLSGAPYLAAPATLRTGGTGFVWKGNPQHPNDAARSLPSPEVLGPLAAWTTLVDLQTPTGDFLDTARRIQGLDRVITVDTAMAHLCGALGVPCWVMLPAHWTDWRWMRGRDDSPWYGSVRLWRQEVAGDWAGVVARMGEGLAAATS